jgi:hypothetical protein
MTADSFRICPRCGRSVPVADWHKSRCKACYNAYRRERYANDPAYRQKHIEKSRRYREEGPQS